MTNTEKLIEAVEYAKDNDLKWWEVFDSENEAMSILDKTSKEQHDEYEITQMLSLFDEDFFDQTPKKAFKKCLLMLKKELENRDD